MGADRIGTAAMTEAEVAAFFAREFPQMSGEMALERLTPEGVDLRLIVGARHLRPGGTVSGPAIFALADVAIYLAILSRLGPVALAATTNAALDFLRRPAAGVDLVAEVRLLKLGRRLAVADALIRPCPPEGARGAAVARAAMTYAIPPHPGAPGPAVRGAAPPTDGVF